MKEMHLSTEELQQYVLNRDMCAAENRSHAESCPDCRAGIAAYTSLVEGLGRQPRPAFDFDVAAAVMKRLETAPRKKQLPYRYVMAVLIAAIIVIPAWLFRRSAYYVFTDMSVGFLYPLLVVAAVILLWKVLQLYKKYQSVINILNK